MDDASRDGVEAVQLSERMIRSLVPVFMGLDALAECGDDAPAQPVVDHAFEVLAQIGYDQSAGSGLFASTAVRPEIPYLAALKSPPIAKAYAGAASLEGLGDTSQMLSSIQSLASRVDADSQVTAMGELFSVVANGRIADIKENKGPDHELVGNYEKVRDEFIALCGDRRVGEYRRKDLQRYVDQISWLPPEASSQKGFSYCDVARYIEANKAVGGRGLAANTIRQGRVSYIKAIIALGCDDADIRNRVASARLNIPDRAPLPVARIAPDGKGFETVWRAGIATGILSDALLPALGYLTGRRIGLLATLRREDLVQLHGVWAFLIRSHHYREGRWEPVPFKTDASREIIIVPQVMVDAGFVEWVRGEPGPLFPALMACRDPADAAQKRINRLIKDYTGSADLSWVFHALRHGKIDSDRDNQVDTRLIMKQVGHEISDVHNGYGRLTPKQMKAIAAAAPPVDVDWSLLGTIDFEAFSKARPWRRRPKK
ncbi:site-specific integrase [Devosia salina]|uniref:Tyr recombinase domain-containing protein n=1 Tax=Devosia salina TaxID=2860336 RepID=A0ABX8WFY9_9HYPH|nr:site-specific integrase [Devosia salina]QYO76569.1 hypothetical protein K1X15_18580 [Devosia salina]